MYQIPSPVANRYGRCLRCGKIVGAMVSHQEQPLPIKRVYQMKRILDRISVNMLEWLLPPDHHDFQ
jgi:hypothetical protein